jgi:hypothetical protein
MSSIWSGLGPTIPLETSRKCIRHGRRDGVIFEADVMPAAGSNLIGIVHSV